MELHAGMKTLLRFVNIFLNSFQACNSVTISNILIVLGTSHHKCCYLFIWILFGKKGGNSTGVGNILPYIHLESHKRILEQCT